MRSHGLKIAPFAALLLLALALIFFDAGRTSVHEDPDAAAGRGSPVIADGSAPPPSNLASEHVREAVDPSGSSADYAPPASAPWGVLPRPFSLKVLGAGRPVAGAVVEYGPFRGATDQTGTFAWPLFAWGADLKIQHPSFIALRGWANESEMTVTLLGDCQLELLVVRDGVPVPGAEILAYALGGRIQPRATDQDSLLVASGTTDEAGWFRAPCASFDLETGAIASLEVEVRTQSGRNGHLFIVHHDQEHPRASASVRIFRQVLDLARRPADVRLQVFWKHGRQPDEPAANAELSWRGGATARSLWRSGSLDAFGSVDLGPSFDAHGVVLVRTPSGRWASSEGGQWEWRDPQHPVLRIPDREATLLCMGSPLPPGIHLEARQLAISTQEPGSKTVREVMTGMRPVQADWMPVSMGSRTPLSGGWTGDRLGVEIRAQPGEVSLALIPCDASGAATFKVPDLLLLDVDGSLLSEDWRWAKVNVGGGPSERAAYHVNFHLIAQRRLLALPRGRYAFRVAGMNALEPHVFDLHSPGQSERLPWH